LITLADASSLVGAVAGVLLVVDKQLREEE
jgi:hypothetical protein